MKTILVEVEIGIGFANASRKSSFKIEVPDHLTDEEIEKVIAEDAQDAAFNFIDWSYSFKEVKA